MKVSRKLLRLSVAVINAILLATLEFSRPSRASEVETIRIVQIIMETPDDKIDFARAKLTFDKIYDPSTDIDARLKEVDAMARGISAMAGRAAPSRLRLTTLRKYIYEAGAWNEYRPFAYDMSDPLGHKPKNRLLSTYLLAHRGNCERMPILFVALAQRLGLKATLSTAPDHIFVKYFDDVTGRTLNLETTSGAYPARDIYIRQSLPMTDAAIANGIYMKTLSRRETLVVMAGIAIESEMENRHFQAAWDIAGLLGAYYPNDLAVLLTPADAAMGLVREEYLSKYPTEADTPPERLARLAFLERAASNALNHAYELGWRQPDDRGPMRNFAAAER